MNIFKAMVFSIIILLIPLECFAQEIPKELYDEKYLKKVLKVGSFDILKNENYNFNGVLKVDKFGKYKELFCVAGRYKRKTKKGERVFVGIMSHGSNGFKKEKVFNFFSEKIDELQFRKGLIYVVFTGESENFGWIEWKENKFNFVVFYDPEL